MPTAMNPDRIAELEEERRFLLRSLADLEREFEAGDVDEVDYRELKDGYTARAAATLRSIEDGRSSLPEAPAADWRRRVFSAVIVVALVAVVWWALAASSAQRLPGQEITGLDPRSDRAIALSQARAIELDDPAGAASINATLLEDELHRRFRQRLLDPAWHDNSVTGRRSSGFVQFVPWPGRCSWSKL